MYKKVFLLVFTLLFLTSCWDDDIDTISTSWLTNHDSTDFFIQIPSSWEIIKDKENILPKPSSGEIELAVTSKDINAWFANNLLILSTKLNSFTTSKDFSILNNIWAEKDYINYKKLNSKNIVFADEEESIMYIFEAKYNTDTPKLKFIQTSHICDQNKAFFFTIALLPSVKDTSRYEDMLRTFKCK